MDSIRRETYYRNPDVGIDIYVWWRGLMPTNWKQLKAIEQKNRERILAICPEMQDRSGIYMFYRADENGDIFARYIGKSETSILERCASHLRPFASTPTHIDASLKKHGLYSESNPTGWKVKVLEYCLPQQCNERERYYIDFATKIGIDLHNIESGGTTGKTDINGRKPARGYRDGVKQGERNVIKQIKHLFDLHLKAVYKADKPSKNAIKALDTFNSLLQGETDNGNT